MLLFFKPFSLGKLIIIWQKESFGMAMNFIYLILMGNTYFKVVDREEGRLYEDYRRSYQKYRKSGKRGYRAWVWEESNDASDSSDSDHSCEYRWLSAVKCKNVHQYYANGIYLVKLEVDNCHLQSNKIKCNRTKDIYYSQLFMVVQIYSLFDPATYKKFNLDITKNNHIVNFASKYGKIDFLEWWRKSGTKLNYSYNTINWIIKHGSAEVKEWWLGWVPEYYEQWLRNKNPAHIIPVHDIEQYKQPARFGEPLTVPQYEEPIPGQAVETEPPVCDHSEQQPEQPKSCEHYNKPLFCTQCQQYVNPLVFQCCLACSAPL